MTGLVLGEPAPDFTLKTNDGEAELTLSKLVGPKPVVLVFGNFPCGPLALHLRSTKDAGLHLYRQGCNHPRCQTKGGLAATWRSATARPPS